MLVFGTQIHILTFIFITLEFMMFSYQLIYCLYRPQEQNRFYYLGLLLLMLFYNITGGLFPDPTLQLPVSIQEMIAYGSGFLMASYFPFYFYKAFDLQKLRWHVRYGVPLFLFAPYVVFFVIDYAIRGNLEKDLIYGMVVPFIYAMVLLYAMLSAIRKKYTAERNRKQYLEEIAMYCAISPWAALAVFGVVEESQVLEVICTNTGIVVLSVLFIRKTILKARKDHEQLREFTMHGNEKVFEANCQRCGLTKREIQIAPYVIEGRTHKQIADLLFIAERTMTTHIANIYRKTGAHSKIELLNILYRPHQDET